MAQPSEINLGDYLRACEELHAGPEVCIEIARVMDLAAPATLPEKPPAQTAAIDRQPISASAVVLPPPVPVGATASVATAGEYERRPQEQISDTSEIPSELTRLFGTRMDNSLKSLEDIPSDTTSARAPDILPLFPPQQTRTILSRALARVAHTGPWNFARVVDQCARGEALTDLLRLPEPTLSGGVQLLVDRSDTMMVFALDQSKMELVIRKLVGESKIQVLSFQGFPSRAGSGGKRRWRPYEEQLPPPGTVVAVLSDLGIGQAAWLPFTAETDEWRNFAKRLRRRGCPVVAFVPYPRDRWPSELRHSITMIHWDRPTRTSAIRASVGLGLRVEK